MLRQMLTCSSPHHRDPTCKRQGPVAWFGPSHTVLRSAYKLPLVFVALQDTTRLYAQAITKDVSSSYAARLLPEKLDFLAKT